MKRELIVIFSVLFLIFGIVAQSTFVKADEGNSQGNQSVTSSGNGEDNDNTSQSNETNGTANRLRETITERIKEAIKEKNRLRLNASNLPENCTATGSVIKCGFKGNRTMAIFAGNSGNVIVQVKGINASTSTQVQLYKSNGSLYALLQNNETVLINYLPDQLRERIMERLHAQTQNESMNITEDGNYTVQLQKQARFLGLFKIRERMMLKVNPQTGDILEKHAPWWGFLAGDVKPEPVLGESCGTVTPGENDLCCQNRGYDFWNETSQECGFNDNSTV